MSEARRSPDPSEARRSPYLISARYDWAFFLLPPLVSLLLGIVISGTSFSARAIQISGQPQTGSKFLIGILIHAHLVAVLFRSHGNATIRRLHPLRFFLVPVLLFLLIRSSAWIALSASVVAVWWDVWHSGAQTFGFGRIYDRNRGNPPDAGRRLDYFLNQVLYLGPILGGVTLVDHLVQLDGYRELGSQLFVAVPAYATAWRGRLALVFIALATIYLAYYLFSYFRLYRQGYRVSPLKVFLFVSTSACSVYTWGFNTWGEAFFIMNLFHAVQYLALVWATEGNHLCRSLGRFGRSRGLVLSLFLISVLAYGVVAELVDLDRENLWSITMVVALLHFWYDGFIWSVAKRQI